MSLHLSPELLEVAEKDIYPLGKAEYFFCDNCKCCLLNLPINSLEAYKLMNPENGVCQEEFILKKKSSSFIYVEMFLASFLLILSSSKIGIFLNTGVPPNHNFI